jgi:hypothetical protein
MHPSQQDFSLSQTICISPLCHHPNKSMPYTQTAFSQAIFKMFDNLDFWLAKNYADLPNNSLTVYIFGGCALHLHTGVRTSNDVDAELKSIPQLKPIHTLEKVIQSVDFDDEQGFPRSLDWDGAFQPSIAPIDPLYEDRATLIHTTQSGLIFIYLVSAVDIAVSKLGRLESVDRDDIQALYREGLFSKQEFLDTAEEAYKYSSVAMDKLKFNIDLASDLLDEETR